jgi:uncharacterized protein (TIGR03067 family)
MRVLIVALFLIVSAGSSLVVSVAVGAAQPPKPGPEPAPTPAAELKRMQGAWAYHSQTIGGWELPKDQRDAIWVEVKGDLMTKTGGAGGRLKYKIKLDPAADPKTIDLVSHEHPSGKTFVQKGIYRWEGEVLRLCFDNTGKERPKEFVSPDGQDNIYMSVLKRKEK